MQHIIPTYEALCDLHLLETARKIVTNKATAGGVDRKSSKSFTDQDLKKLHTELVQHKYVPEPHLAVKIPKGENAYRHLGLLTVRDKILQTAILLQIEPLIDQTFYPSSFAYRKGLGPVDASRKVFALIKSNQFSWAAKMDIKNFFDSVDHTLLATQLQKHISDPELFNLIMLCLKMGTVDWNNQWQDRLLGIPQGSILSPLMANLYLTELDRAIADEGAAYVRYADDFIVLTKNEKSAANIIGIVKQFVAEALHLELNEKSYVAPLRHGVEFLGIRFYNNHYTLASDKINSLKHKIDQAIEVDKGINGRKLRDVLEGIHRYYARMVHEKVLLPIDAHLLESIESFCTANKTAFSSALQLHKMLEGVWFITNTYKEKRHAEARRIVSALFQKGSAVLPEQIRIDQQSLIEAKKRAYEKLERRGFELLIHKSGVFLGKTYHHFTVKEKGELLFKAPLANVKHISILGEGVSVSGYALCYCAENNIPIDFYVTHGQPVARVYSMHTHDSDLLMKQLQALTNGKGHHIAYQLVVAKIKNQLNTIKYLTKNDVLDNACASFTEPLDVILQELDQIKPFKEELRITSGKLFAYEGRAAAIYWRFLVEKLAPVITFSGRERQGATDPVNVMLNYGYGILYARVWDALLKARLNPEISYLHAGQSDKPGLSFDLIEPFRQNCVDRVVYALLKRNEIPQITNGSLHEDSRKRLAEVILERLYTPISYRGERIYMQDVIRMQAVHLRNFICGKEKSFKPWIFKW